VAAMVLAVAAGCGGSSGPTGDSDGDRDNGNKGGVPVEQEVIVNSDSPTGISRLQAVNVSVPFSRGQSKPKDLEKMGVDGRKTAWRVLQSWGDGSVRVAQAQFVDTFEGGQSRRYKIVKETSAALDPFAPHPWIARQKGKFTVMPEVVDDDGVSYYGLITGEGTLLHSSYFSRTRFWRLYLYNLNPNAGIKRDFLAARVYMTEFADMPFVATDLVVGNDYLGADDPKGSKDKNLYPLDAVSFKEIKIHVAAPYTEIRMRERHGIQSGVWNASAGSKTFVALQNTHLDDGQTKLWSILSYLEDPAAPKVDRDAWKLTWQEEVDRPLRPMADRKSWQGSEALGINGGPTTGPANAWDLAERDWNSWKGANHFGPVADWGDAKATATTGTPRNHPLSPELARCIQGENPHLLEVMEGQATQQALRQYHLWGLRVQATDDIYLWFALWFGITGDKKLSEETLGRYAIRRSDYAYDPYKPWRRNVPSSPGHGWNAYDPEHSSVDILFDYYTMTGSFWARDELAILGEWIKGVMRFQKYNSSGVQTARAEGWVMQSWLQCWLATGDDSIKDYALRRITEVVDKGRNKTHPSRCVNWQWNYPGTGYPNDTAFYMPWQHAAVIYGYLAAHRFWDSQVALQIAEDVVRTADYASVVNFTDPVTKKFHAFDMRYYVPAILTGNYQNQQYNNFMTPPNFFDNDPQIGPHLGGGTAVFLVSGMYLVADWTKDNALRGRAFFLGDKLLGEVSPERTNFLNKWASVIPDHLVPGVRK
jgi:hypothetical protein